MKKKIVEVTWRDPTIDSGWCDNDHDKPLPYLKSYGIFVSKNREQLVIAGSYDPAEKKYGDRTKFPTGCIKEIRIIEVINI